ncbi:transposase [Mesorhizobium sp. LSHC414A00]|uniref:transposase n=1 Tax=Mesorhizobium sp. LSHC414A00 TaxID=1287287 RepID=UPI000A00F5D7|nr:transposase [Mesorhizobium sp. LSHC414A00]
MLKRGCSPSYPAHQGRTDSKLHAVCDGDGRPLILLLSEGQMSDHKGARLVLDALPPAAHLIADRGYDRAWFREELAARDIEPCIPSSKAA